MSSIVYLSHTLNLETPVYGGADSSFMLERKRDISLGDHANNSMLHFSAHMGTHIDMPFHFYEDGQTIEHFPASFWIFSSVLMVEIEPETLVIEKELMEALDKFDKKQLGICDLLLVKTGQEAFRGTRTYWEKNTGFSPLLYDYLILNLPNLRVFGFDSISLSSFQHRDIGRQAHKAFLNSQRPILPLGDMSLSRLSQEADIKRVVVSPLLVEKCDGLPCTVMGWLADEI